MPTKYASGDRGLAWYSSFNLWSIRMYAASFSTRCPIRNIEYTSEPMSVTAIRSGARTATKISKAPGLRDDVQRIPFLDTLAERSEPLPMVPAVLDRDAQRPTDLSFGFFRGSFEKDATFLDDVQPFRERLGLIEVMSGEEDRAAFSRQIS